MFPSRIRIIPALFVLIVVVVVVVDARPVRWRRYQAAYTAYDTHNAIPNQAQQSGMPFRRSDCE